MLEIEDFTLYLPFAAGGAAVYAGIAIARGRLPRGSVARRWAVASFVFVSLVLLGPYMQRFVTRVVDREGGGAAALAGLSIFITGAIAYVVFLGQQYESARTRAEQGLRDLTARTNDIEDRESVTAAQEKQLTEGLANVEAAIGRLDQRVKHETLRAVALHALDSARRRDEPAAGLNTTGRILLILLQDLVGRTTPAAVAFDLVEVKVALQEFAASEEVIDRAVQRTVGQYLGSLEGFAATPQQATALADVRDRISSLPLDQ